MMKNTKEMIEMVVPMTVSISAAGQLTPPGLRSLELV